MVHPMRLRRLVRTAKRSRHAPIAQLDRALPSEGRGQRFESSWVRHSPMCRGVKRLIRDDERRFNRLALGSVVGSFILVGIAFALTLAGLNGARRSGDLVTHSFQVKDRLAMIDLAVERAESARRGYLLAPSTYREGTFRRSSDAILPNVEQLVQLTADNPAQMRRLRELKPLLLKELSELDRSMGLAAGGGLAEARRDFASVAYFATLREIRSRTEVIGKAEDALLAARSSQDAARQSTLNLFLIVVGAMLLLSAAGTVLLVRSYTRDLARSSARLHLLNTNLEDAVTKRTADLSVSNSRLQTLLREVNHRVANSLQLVSAMVSMQSRHVSDGAAHDALEDTQRRIHAVAQVHRSLYTSDEVESVAMDDYLASIVAELEGSWSSPLARRDVRLTADPIRLDTDRAVALGMIVNELVTNACKYAYEEGESGEIRVALSQRDGDQYELTVEDDGRGFCGDAEPRGSGLGSRILTAMASSLSSKLVYDDDFNGCRAVLVAAL